MPSKSLYTHKSYTDAANVAAHSLAKFDKELNFQVEYILTKSPSGWVCTCPARMQICRHVRMIGIFTEAEAGNDKLYNSRKSLIGEYTMFLEYDGKMFDWVTGPESEPSGA